MYRRRQLTNQLLVTHMKGILCYMCMYVHVHNYMSHFPTSFHLWNLMIRDSSRRFHVLGYSLLPRHRSFDFLLGPLYLSSCYSRSKLIRKLYRVIDETMRRRVVLSSYCLIKIIASRIAAWERDEIAVRTRERIREQNRISRGENIIRILVENTMRAPISSMLSIVRGKATCGRPLFFRFIEPHSRFEESNNTNFTLPWQAGCDHDYANN